MRTSEQLKQYFQRIKQEKLQKKEKLKKEKQKSINDQFNSIINADKEAKMKELYELVNKIKKIRQEKEDNKKKLKISYSKFKIHIAGNPLIESGFDDYGLLLTKEELQKWERDNNLYCIKWENWDRIIQSERNRIEEFLKNLKY